MCSEKIIIKKFADLKKIVDILNLMTIKLFGGKFLKFWSFINFPWDHVMFLQNLGPVGSAVLTFIGCKQTDRQTDKQTDRQDKFIYRCPVIL